MGLCHFLNNPVLFGVTVVVPVSGCLVLIPFRRSFPFTWARDGHEPVTGQRSAGGTCLRSWKSRPCQNCVSVAPELIPPSPTDAGAFSGRDPECAGSLLLTGLLSPSLREAGANPAQPGAPPCLLQLRRTKSCAGWFLRTGPSRLPCPWRTAAHVVNREDKVFIDLCRFQRKCKSEIPVWAAWLEKLTVP